MHMKWVLEEPQQRAALHDETRDARQDNYSDDEDALMALVPPHPIQ
jgi:hypothetical protein